MPTRKYWSNSMLNSRKAKRQTWMKSAKRDSGGHLRTEVPGRFQSSSVVQQDSLYHLDRFLNVPAALIVQDPNPMLAAGAIIMEIPMIDRLPQEFYDTVKDSN